MKTSLGSIEIETKRWYKNPRIWTITTVIVLVLTIVIPTTVLLLKNHFEKNNPTHIHYTRLNKNIYNGGYELYRLDVLAKRNPAQQYKLLGNFLRLSLFNKSNYEQYLPSCPIILALSLVDHPEDWRGMLFGTMNLPRQKKPYPYVCYLSVMPGHRRHKLGSILLNQFINDMSKTTKPPVTHIQLHTNWENCRAQKLYNRCGFQCTEFTPNGYSKPFEPVYQFGHMIRMELNMTDIRNKTGVCHSSEAVEISKEDTENYKKLCNQNIPPGTNRTC